MWYATDVEVVLGGLVGSYVGEGVHSRWPRCTVGGYMGTLLNFPWDLVATLGCGLAVGLWVCVWGSGGLRGRWLLVPVPVGPPGSAHP